MINNQGRPAEESVQVQKWPGAGRREEEERMEGRKEGGERRGRTGGRIEKARLSANLPVDLSRQESGALTPAEAAVGR